jgi:uncharacterized membrane protein
MTMKLPDRLRPTLLPALAAAALTLLPLDALWLTFMGPRLYAPTLGTLAAARPDWLAAGLFYVLYLFALTKLAVQHPRDCASAEARRASAAPLAALQRGAIFGLAAYGTYDLTNQATLAQWSWTVTLADMAWGTLLSAVSAFTAQAAIHAWPRKTAPR